MDRRVFLQTVGAGSGAALAGKAAQMKPVERKGRIKQSACRWCYNKIPAEDFVREGVRLGLKSIDLAPAAEWPILKKHGLPPTMIGGGTTIPDGFNRKENHAGIEERFRESVRNAVTFGAPSIIVFSGNRRGMSDEEGLENCVTGLKKIMPIAEDKGILVCMELLNSKVDHADYMCDHTKWGVELVKRVASPHFKLLYDIYHMQIMEGNVIENITKYIRHIAHIHTGGVPGRHELDETQELYYPAIMKAIVKTGYKGYVGQEFVPAEKDKLTSLKKCILICDV